MNYWSEKFINGSFCRACKEEDDPVEKINVPLVKSQISRLLPNWIIERVHWRGWFSKGVRMAGEMKRNKKRSKGREGKGRDGMEWKWKTKKKKKISSSAIVWRRQFAERLRDENSRRSEKCLGKWFREKLRARQIWKMRNRIAELSNFTLKIFKIKFQTALSRTLLFFYLKKVFKNLNEVNESSRNSKPFFFYFSPSPFSFSVHFYFLRLLPRNKKIWRRR